MSALRQALLQWYRTSRRDLPWRRDSRPYAVLVSEVMLQQTRVDTVVGYYERFMARFPTMADLARADLSEVLQLWQGLGYYRRARFLHAAAQACDGVLPSTPEALRALPGVGAYTAGAVASIAFGAPVPAVDGNVERVICRLWGIEDDPKRAAGRRAIEQAVLDLQAEGVASEVTQGLMELGALVCTPTGPRCGACPWEAPCVARSRDLVDVLPRKAARKAPQRVRGVAALVRRDGGGDLLLGRRPQGLLGGLWEPPWMEVDGLASQEAGLSALLRVRCGVRGRVVGSCGEVVHVFSHRHLTLEVFEVTAERPVGLVDGGFYEAWGWEPIPGTERPLSVLARKVLKRRAHPALPLAASP